MKNWLRRIYFRLRSNVTTEDLVGLGMKVGKNFRRMHDVILDPSHCWHIQIGDNVTMAPRVHVLAHDASFHHHTGYGRIGNVIIGNNVFIGADTVILPNVTIGDNSIIGANSTVSKDVPANSVAAGSPAKVICTLEEYLEKNNALMQTRPVYGEEYTLRNGITDEMKRQMFEELKSGVGFVK
ncbi:acyltransferase [Flavobacterium sp.]|uniref:acyltransferase n=1 Tax=Flavobacterium sp. TaxID=239 RepID=UPI0012026E7F|nr:acyltransferase [Flavobacterium sp.]RZJ70836.1 MAG: acyltransferase [Flavobacterium sp.]